MGYSCQGPGEEGFPAGRSFDLVESVSRFPEVEAPEALQNHVNGSKFETALVLLPSSLFLAGPYFLGALQAWGISMGMRP